MQRGSGNPLFGRTTSIRPHLIQGHANTVPCQSRIPPWACAVREKAGRNSPRLFPLDGARGLGRDVIADAVDAARFDDDAVGDARQHFVGQAAPVGGRCLHVSASGPAGSPLSQKVFNSKTDVFCDLAQQNWREIAPAMKGNARPSSVGVPVLSVRSFLAYRRKAESLEDGCHFRGLEDWGLSHCQAISTV